MIAHTHHAKSKCNQCDHLKTYVKKIRNKCYRPLPLENLLHFAPHAALPSKPFAFTDSSDQSWLVPIEKVDVGSVSGEFGGNPPNLDAI